MARKILLADDSVTAQNMGRKILSDAGYEVTAVNNGSAALKKIAEIKPDLIVLDVYMPGYSGLEVCQRLKDAPETASTPVLLTVGKLEPFKPEEAQRVRAEGFIVKPFEASELLSALSKLEDKVVPRPESSKQGRFARTMAVVEASDRDRGETNDANGWKKRINFPPAVPAEEKPADDSALYNPVNRDLRTVVETSAEKGSAQANPAAGTTASVDVTALAPAGLPTDVTPEELAAITAAAAQIQAAETGNKSDAASEAAPPQAQQDVKLAPAASNPPAIVTEKREFPVEAAPVEPGHAETGRVEASRVESPVPVSASEPVRADDSAVSHDEPVTMAASPESVPASEGAGSRWAAVSVALDDAEASLSLSDEMQKAGAAVATADAPAAQAQAPAEAQSAPASAVETGTLSNSADSSSSVPSAVSSAAAESDASALSESTNSAVATISVSSSAVPTSAISGADLPAQFSSAGADFSAVQAPDSRLPESTALVPEPSHARAEAQTENIQQPVADSHSADPRKDTGCGGQTESQPEVAEKKEEIKQEEIKEKSAAAYARAAVAGSESSSFKVFTSTQEPVAGDNLNNSGAPADRDADTVAAWSNWNQIRELQRVDDSSAQPRPEGSAEVSGSLASSSQIADAGAERGSSATAGGNTESKDVASIVESVLADLRPRLMEEISRKMGQKK